MDIKKTLNNTRIFGEFGKWIIEEPDPHYIARMEWYYGIKDAAILCWSLAALLAAIPVIAEYNGTSIRLRIDKGHTGNDEYAIWYEDLQTNLSTDIEVEVDNFIDACYEIIMRLHKLNLL